MTYKGIFCMQYHNKNEAPPQTRNAFYRGVDPAEALQGDMVVR